MNAYLLQLGHCPDLSHAEVLSVADRLGDVLHVQRRLDSVLFAEGADPERIQELCGELGGTIRLCEIKPFGEADRFDFMPDPSPEQLFDALLSTKIGDELIARNPRPLFGFSILDESHWGGRVKKIIGLLHETASLFKDHLKERGHASRFVRPNPEGKSACLGGAQVEKNALLQKGGEIVFHLHPETGLTLGMTQWLQPFEAYSKRDYGRPQRDARQGMLPPKLARMMVNIARTDSTSTLLDPFCGSGSILMEAGLLGLQTTGVDINRKAVQSSLGNWDWLKGQGGEPTGGLRAIYGDARNLRHRALPGAASAFTFGWKAVRSPDRRVDPALSSRPGRNPNRDETGSACRIHRPAIPYVVWRSMQNPAVASHDQTARLYHPGSTRRLHTDPEESSPSLFPTQPNRPA